jgi:prophage tail gpP-like protein
MELRIGTRKIEMYNQVSVTLAYDAVASSFSFAFYFDPNNADHKAIFKPGAYLPVTIDHDGERLLTGVLLSPTFKDRAEQQLATLSGYSKTGVLEDCEIPTTAYPLQSNNLSLKQIAEKCVKPFGLKVVVDAAVSSKAGTSYKVTTATNGQSVREYLATLAGQKHIILSHDAAGNLVLTQAATKAQPVYHFDGRFPALEMSLAFNGQNMHSGLTMIKQQTKGGKGNAGQSSLSNPFVPAGVVRPRINRQTSGKDVDTGYVARNMLSDELRGVALEIVLPSWTLGGKLVRPNSIITVNNPAVYCYKTTRWFIASVEYSGDNNEETAKLSCVLPSVFASETPVNIFE